MAEKTEKTEARRSSKVRDTRIAFREGEKVEYEGQLAKVVSYRVVELTERPGQDAVFTDGPVLALQLPASEPGGKPDYVMNVQPDAVKKLEGKDGDPKRLRSLEVEYNPLFGDAAPVEPEKDTRKAPAVRQGAAPEAKRTSSTRGRGGKVEAEVEPPAPRIRNADAAPKTTRRRAAGKGAKAGGKK